MVRRVESRDSGGRGRGFATHLARTFERFRLWLRILARLRGASARTNVGLIASTVLDTLLFLAGSDRALSPKSYVSGLVRSRADRASFYVRGGTDDIYCVMPHREADVEELIRTHLRPGGTFVDVGANVGYYSVIAGGIIGKRGRIVAVEPIPATFAILVRNLSMNGLDHVQAVNEACWDSRSDVLLGVPAGNFGWASAVDGVPGPRVQAVARPLDELTDHIGHVDIVKIDVEGAELRVLRGATRTLSKTARLVIEVTRNREDVLRLLNQASFTVRELNYPNYIVASRT